MARKNSNHRFPDKDEERQDTGNKAMSKSGQGHEGNKKSPAESHPPSLSLEAPPGVTASPATDATPQLASD